MMKMNRVKSVGDILNFFNRLLPKELTVSAIHSTSKEAPASLTQIDDVKVNFFKNLPREIALSIIHLTSRTEQTRLARVDKNLNLLVNDPTTALSLKQKERNLHPFAKEIKKLLDLYDLRAEKKSSLFPSIENFFSRSCAYIDDLRKVYTQIEKKSALTVYDLWWFYKECYNPTGKYSTPQLFSRNSTDLPAQIYQNIENRLLEYFPKESDIGKVAHEAFPYGLYYRDPKPEPVKPMPPP